MDAISMKLSGTQAAMLAAFLKSMEDNQDESTTSSEEKIGGRPLPKYGDLYHHYKGGLYYILDVAVNTTNDAKDKRVVIYRKAGENEDTSISYVRSLDEFMSIVSQEKCHNGKVTYRFTKVQ